MLRHAIPDIDLRTKLEERGWECHLLLRGKDQTAFAFSHELCCEIEELLKAAYHREPTEVDLKYETWGVIICPPSGSPIACATLSFASSGVSSFKTRFEAVHPSVQKTGVGRLLFECLAVWARFLVFNDVLVRDGVINSDGKYFLVSCIDAEEMDEADCSEAWEDNMDGDGAFLRKLGFIKAQHDFGQIVGEIAFQREFHVPVEEEEDDA